MKNKLKIGIAVLLAIGLVVGAGLISTTTIPADESSTPVSKGDLTFKCVDTGKNIVVEIPPGENLNNQDGSADMNDIRRLANLAGCPGDITNIYNHKNMELRTVQETGFTSFFEDVRDKNQCEYYVGKFWDAKSKVCEDVPTGLGLEE